MSLPPPPPPLPKQLNPVRSVPNLVPAKANKNASAPSTLTGPAPSGPPGTKTNPSLTNPNLNWLTFESLYNDERFIHTDGMMPMGIYSSPIDKLRIIAFSNLFDPSAPKDRLKHLKDTFFPDITEKELEKIAYKPWEKFSPNYDTEWEAEVKKFWTEAEAKHKPGNTPLPKALLPYNVVNNRQLAAALGTRNKDTVAGDGGPDPKNPDLKIEPHMWHVWQSASRSCITRTIPITRLETEGKDLEQKSYYEPTPGVRQWSYLIERSLNQVPPKDAPGPTPSAFDFLQKAGLTPADALRECYSVKTGVVYVGKQDQGGVFTAGGMGGKGMLEPDSIVAALRTEYMDALDALYATRNSSHVNEHKKEIVILPELLTVTAKESEIYELKQEKTPFDPTSNFHFGEQVYVKKIIKQDGFQLRDLSRMNPSMRYFPALSATYVPGNGDLATWKPEQLLTDDEYKLWDSYWDTNYAARIGKAKALLHVFYGFAPLTPNMQNFLFEVDATKKPPAFTRTFLRDVLDFRLHTAWVRTTLSSVAEKDANVGVDLSDKAKPFAVDPALADKKLENLFKYEQATESPMEPGSKLMHSSETVEVKVAGAVQFYGGLQLNWFGFTTPFRGDRIAAATEAPPNWRRSYAAAVKWGLTHAITFVDTVNAALTDAPSVVVSKLKHSPDSKVAAQTITRDYLKDLAVPDPNDASKTFTLGAELQTLNDTTKDVKHDAMAAVHKKLFAWDLYVSKAIEDAIYKDASNRIALRRLVRGGD